MVVLAGVCHCTVTMVVLAGVCHCTVTMVVLAGVCHCTVSMVVLAGVWAAHRQDGQEVWHVGPPGRRPWPQGAHGRHPVQPQRQADTPPETGGLYPEHQIRCVKWISIDANSFISWPNPMFDHLLESSHRDDSDKWSNIGFGQEIDVLEIKIRTLSGALMFSLYM